MILHESTWSIIRADINRECGCRSAAVDHLCDDEAVELHTHLVASIGAILAAWPRDWSLGTVGKHHISNVSKDWKTTKMIGCSFLLDSIHNSRWPGNLSYTELLWISVTVYQQTKSLISMHPHRGGDAQGRGGPWDGFVDPQRVENKSSFIEIHFQIVFFSKCLIFYPIPSIFDPISSNYCCIMILTAIYKRY